MSLLPVEDALKRMLERARPISDAEDIPVSEAAGRVLARDAVARRTQPPFDASGMDGYAVRAADLAIGRRLLVIGESAAGRGFSGAVGAGKAVRIFTGAPVPTGADTILIQENATAVDGGVVPANLEVTGRFVRRAGLDFRTGDAVFPAGRLIRPKDLALLSGLGGAEATVTRRPRVAIVATGDELVAPGEAVTGDSIVATNHIAVAAIVAEAGGEPLLLGIAPDREGALRAAFAEAEAARADVLVTIGGASVGEHDLVRQALASRGLDLAFWRIAMRPGKPMMFGSLDPMLVLGLPGNPASSIVCATLFLAPLVEALLGRADAARDRTEACRISHALGANDQRQDYLRAVFDGEGEDGIARVTSLPLQDSSMTRALGQADGLLIRVPHAPAAAAGDRLRWMRF
jgi:molybdopterin molybdotransferase